MPEKYTKEMHEEFRRRQDEQADKEAVAALQGNEAKPTTSVAK